MNASLPDREPREPDDGWNPGARWGMDGSARGRGLPSVGRMERGEVDALTMLVSVVLGLLLGGVIDSVGIGLLVGFSTPFVGRAALDDLRASRALHEAARHPAVHDDDPTPRP